jgi:asparagine synthase (glutamine-hydrolysing)
MGGIAAIVQWDRTPVDREALGRMVRAAPHPAPDGAPAAVGERVALAHLRFTTTNPPSAGPLVDRVRGLWFVFDGRLDNRDELRSRLGQPDPDLSDASIAFEAFARWGDGAAGQLLGDFAFIGWDDRARRLVCGRDHFGIRPLHYYASPREVVVATDLAQVLAHPAVPKEPEPSVAADYLTIDVRNGPGTLYRGLFRVPPGHVLVAESGSVRLAQYWSAEPRRTIRYTRDADYAEHCRELLTRAVEARMRSDRPIAAMLSGGLDSSSVVSIAHRVVKWDGPRPQPFSMVYPGNPEADERPFIDAVASHCGTTSVHVLPGRITAAALQRQAQSWGGTPSMPADEMANTLFRAMSAAGHRVALTGGGGDFLFSGSLFQYADLLRQFRLLATLRRFIDDRYGGDTGWSPLGLLHAGVWPILPLRVKNALRPLARRAVNVDPDPAWLCIRRSPSELFPASPRGGSYATEEVTRQLGSGMHQFFLECAERTSGGCGIELRHPLLDARLIEFALGIPDDQRKRGRQTKYVLRQALGDDLAPVVRSRRTKGDFAHAVAEAIESLGGERFYTHLQIAEAGWVRADIVAAKYRTMRDQYPAGSDVYGDHVPALWMIAAVELWFRAAFGRSDEPAVEPVGSGRPRSAAAPHGVARPV